MNLKRPFIFIFGLLAVAFVGVVGLIVPQAVRAYEPMPPQLLQNRCDSQWASSINTAVSQTYNISPDSLLESLHNGATLAELADSPLELMRLKADLLKVAQARLDTAVSNDLLTQEQADKIAPLLPLAVDQLVENGGGPYWGQGYLGGRLWGYWHDTAADTVGVSVESLANELFAGVSLGEVADSQGVEVDVLVSNLLATPLTKLDQAVANGLITADQAERVSQRLETAVSQLIYVAGPCSVTIEQ